MGNSGSIELHTYKISGDNKQCDKFDCTLLSILSVIKTVI